MNRLKKFFGAQDMTVGKPLSNLIVFSVPLLIGNLAQQMYNTADSIIVGRYVGDSALAAVGASGPILNLLLLLFMGISTGAGILVSQYFGAHRQEELEKSVALMRHAAGNGVGIVLIEHKMDMIMNVCDHIVVLNFGKMIAHGTPEQVQSDDAVIEAYLGR